MSAAATATATTTTKKPRFVRQWDPRKGPEPTRPQNLTEVEAAAIKRLIDEEYLLYSNIDHVCPFPELIEKAEKAWDRCDFSPLRPLKLSGAKGPHTAALVEEVESLKEDLILNIGDDVIAGTIFALNVPDEKEYFNLESDVSIENNENNFSVRQNKSNGGKNGNDDDNDNDNSNDEELRQKRLESMRAKRREKEMLQKHASPYFDPGSASAPSSVATRSFDIVADGHSYTFPIKREFCDNLSYGGDQSEVGIEDQGEIQDPMVRESFEYPVSRLELPPWLHHPRRFYPRLEQQIKERLCPGAAEISIVPYKLVCYNEDNHFGQHRDSTNDPKHFGTLAIHLPCEEDYADTRRFENPENYDWGNVKLSDDDGDEDGNQEKESLRDVPARTAGGALRLYLGRGVERHSRNYGSEIFHKSAVQNLMNEGKHGRPSDSVSQLVATVLMQNYTQDELEGKHPFVSASANRLAERLHRPDGTDMTEDEAIAEAQGQDRRTPPIQFTHGKTTRKKLLAKYQNDFLRKTHPPKKNFHQTLREHTPLKFACWLTDVHHEVRPLKGTDSHRFVMTYKVLKGKHVSPIINNIPREIALVSQVERIGELFKKHLQDTPENAKLYPRTIGFILRHCYPVSSLEHPNSCLKNVDAVVHHIVSSRYECVLAPVFTIKDNDVSVPFLDDPQSKRIVFLTATVPSEQLLSLDATENHEQMSKWFPVIGGVEWKELGFGEAFARGSVLGNWDCGARWVYRQTAMVCLFDKPSTWARRRILFLILENGFQGNMIQKISVLYPVFRKIAYFL